METWDKIGKWKTASSETVYAEIKSCLILFSSVLCYFCLKPAYALLT